MRIIKSASAIQRLAQSWRRARVPIALVPTMGCLHAGHASLIVRGRRAVGRRGKLVVSIYVNPTQFGPGEDLAKYPRDWERDRRLCRSLGVDAVFAPDDAQMYPGDGPAQFSTMISESCLARSLEGKSRPTHFRGVTTVVAKLFNLVLPNVAIFGAKDYQQAAIVRRMVRDLNFPVRIEVAPTVREPDGLALSSRNRYLSDSERAQATVLWRAIQTARRAVRAARQPIPASRLRARLSRLITSQPAARIDYVKFVDASTLEPVRSVTPGARLLLAVFIGRTRLIDNAAL